VSNVSIPIAFFDVDGSFRRWQLFMDWIEGMVEGGLFPNIVLERTRPSCEAFRNRQGSFASFVKEAIHAYSGEYRLKGIRISDAAFVADRVVRVHGLETHVFSRELSHAARENGFYRSFISGSPKVVLDPFARLHGFDPKLCFGTEHPHRGGFFTGAPPKTWYDRKSKAVDVLCRSFNLELNQSVAIGDSESDADMLERVGYPICIHPNKVLSKIARERGWPVVMEKKDEIAIFRLNPGRGLRGASLKSVLPPALFRSMEQRIGQFVF
jgi:phosphoserine phosphatase